MSIQLLIRGKKWPSLILFPSRSQSSLLVWVSDRVLKRRGACPQGSVGGAERKNTQGNGGSTTSWERCSEWTGQNSHKSEQTGGGSVCLCFECLCLVLAHFHALLVILFMKWWMVWTFLIFLTHDIHGARFSNHIHVPVWYITQNHSVVNIQCYVRMCNTMTPLTRCRDRRRSFCWHVRRETTTSWIKSFSRTDCVIWRES